jgi:glycosyl transferase, family 25
MPAHSFHPLNCFFGKMFVITLERAHDRHAQLAEHLAGLNYELVYGVDKKALDFPSLAALGEYVPARAMKLNRYVKERHIPLGHIACSWSHRNLYQRMVDQGIGQALILEDDAVPIGPHLAQLAATLAELPPNWELLYLGYVTHERPIPKIKQWFCRALFKVWHGHAYRWRAKDVEKMYPRPFSEHLYRAGYHDCTHAYAITLAAAKKLLKAQTPISYCADSLLTHLVTRHHLNAFIARRKFFDQADFSLGHDGSTSYILS